MTFLPRIHPIQAPTQTMARHLHHFKRTHRRGYQLILLIVLVGVVATMSLAMVNLLTQQLTVSRRQARNEQAYHVAEAGIHYYRWHLAHDPGDFTDGTGQPGPYVHEYRDIDGNLVGQFSLTITPPVLGSTIVTVQSTGTLTRADVPPRTITAKLGIQSLGRYAVVANDVMRFGQGTEIFGPIHSNNGIRYDGIANGLVTSAIGQYDDPDHTDTNVEFGVHTHVNPPPGSGVNNNYRPAEAPPPPPDDRSDVFRGGRQFPVAPINFNGFAVDLEALRTLSQSPSGIYLGPSGGQGYLLRFRTDDRVDLYVVTSQRRCQYRPTSTGPWRDYANIWSYNATAQFTYQGAPSIGVSLPTNGIIFIQDDLWVEGQIDGARVTVVAARDPLTTGSATIVINNDVRYTNTNGSDAIGLFAQKDISVGFYSEDDLRIDAAVIAKSGRVGRYYYEDFTDGVGNWPYNLPPSRFNPAGCGSRLNQSPPGYVHRSTLTLLGTIITNQRYGFAYTDGTGYVTRNLLWDSNLLFSPPPNFPTTGEYTIVDWDEEN